MAGERSIGGWFKVYESILDDPKLDPSRISDRAFRVFFLALAFASRAGWKDRRAGILCHPDGLTVTSADFMRRVSGSEQDVEDALDLLCTLGGADHSLLIRESGVYRVRNFRKWQDGLAGDFRRVEEQPRAENRQDSAETPPENRRDSATHRRKDVKTFRPQTASLLPVEEGQKEEGLASEAARPPASSRASWPSESEALRAIPGYPFDAAKDAALLDSLAATYAQLDLAQEIHRMHSWCAAKGLLPLKGQAGPRLRLANWMKNGDRHGTQTGPRNGAIHPASGRAAPAPAEDHAPSGRFEL